MTAVSDSSCIIGLAAVGRLDVLRALYGEALIPEAVRREVVEQGRKRPGAGEILSADWIRIRTVEDPGRVRRLDAHLGDGEAEAIALALEAGASMLLIDDLRGRRQAERPGLPIAGTVGVLVEAKLKGLLPEIRPVLRSLVDDFGFRIGETLLTRVLRAVGEAD